MSEDNFSYITYCFISYRYQSTRHFPPKRNSLLSYDRNYHI
eukprot:UN08654